MNEQNVVKKKNIDNLHSGNVFLVMETLRVLRHSGDCSYIPELVKLHVNTPNSEIKNAVTKIFFDLKEKAAVPYMIDAIKETQNDETLHALIESCWQNGLNFSQHMPVFVDIMVQREFHIAFEAFTVIENMKDRFTPEQGQEQIAILKDNLTSKDHQTQLLMAELIGIIQRRSE